MKARSATSFAVAATLTFLCTAATAPAQTRGEAKCRDAIAKNVAKYAKTAFKVFEKCHRARSAGSEPLSTDCNDIQEADPRGKLVRAADKLRAAVGGSKNKCFNSQQVLDQFPECPAPAESSDDGGATSGIDSFSELAECLIALANAGLSDGSRTAIGDPDQVLSASVAECQQTIAKSLSKLVTTILNERRKCQRAIDRQGVGISYDCDGADPNGKIGRALVKLNADIDRSCSLPQQDLQTLNSCSDTTVGLRMCVGEGVGMPLGDELARNSYTMGGSTTTTTLGGGTTTTIGGGTTTTVGATTTTTIACGTTFPVCGGDCPSGEFCVNTGAVCECQAGTGTCAPATVIRNIESRLGAFPSIRQTQLSTGWSGTAHQVDIPGDGDSADAVDVVCDANCESCSITLNPMKDVTGRSYCRCDNNPRVACDTVNGPDADDCGGVSNNCTCYFGGPLAISAGGTPVCVLNKIRNDYGGTVNLRDGAWFDTANLASVVHLGISTTAPCPTCQNDVTPNDGVRDGSCAGGLATGACDVNATHPTFGPVSFDCPPNAAQNISGNGLQINLKFSTDTTSLAATLPCDAGIPKQCFCRVCTGNASLGCSSNADCQAAGAGDCTSAGGTGSAGIRPNQCDDLECSAEGECNAGPTDTFCDGTTHADGRGFISCTTDADCIATGQGTCSVSEQRKCYTDPIIVEGHADAFDPVRAAIFCIPATTSAAVNQAGGLPGPGTFDLEFASDVRCRDDVDTPYNFPSGSNCVTVSTTTTTSITLPPCENSTPPVCVGSCGAGEGCQDLGSVCGCALTTTTTLPPCGGEFPLCQGACATGQACLPDILTSTCGCTAIQ